jgi:hypothetical protein
MADPRFDLIALETNALRAGLWPFPTSPLLKLLNLARMVEVRVVLPDAAWAERRAQAERDATEIVRTFKNARKDANKLGVALDESTFTTATALQRVDEAHTALVREFNVASVPITKRTADEFFAEACAQKKPFDASGRGFKDAVILTSLREFADAQGHSVLLVTADSDFANLEAGGNVEFHVLSLGKAIGVLERRAQQDTTALIRQHFEEAIEREGLLRQFVQAQDAQIREALAGVEFPVTTFQDGLLERVIEIVSFELEFVSLVPFDQDVNVGAEVTFSALIVVTADVELVVSAPRTETVLKFGESLEDRLLREALLEQLGQPAPRPTSNRARVIRGFGADLNGTARRTAVGFETLTITSITVTREGSSIMRALLSPFWDKVHSIGRDNPEVSAANQADGAIADADGDGDGGTPGDAVGH